MGRDEKCSMDIDSVNSIEGMLMVLNFDFLLYFWHKTLFYIFMTKLPQKVFFFIALFIRFFCSLLSSPFSLLYCNAFRTSKSQNFEKKIIFSKFKIAYFLFSQCWESMSLVDVDHCTFSWSTAGCTFHHAQAVYIFLPLLK